MTLGRLTILCFNFICTGTVALFALFLMYRAYGRGEEQSEGTVASEHRPVQQEVLLPQQLPTNEQNAGKRTRIEGERRLAEEYFSWAKTQRELTAQ